MWGFIAPHIVKDARVQQPEHRYAADQVARRRWEGGQGRQENERRSPTGGGETSKREVENLVSCRGFFGGFVRKIGRSDF